MRCFLVFGTGQSECPAALTTNAVSLDIQPLADKHDLRHLNCLDSGVLQPSARSEGVRKGNDGTHSTENLADGGIGSDDGGTGGNGFGTNAAATLPRPDT